MTAYFINQITLGASPSSAESRISHGARASAAGGHLRSPPRRTTSAGNPAAEVQSLRNVFMGRELGDCPPLGNNTAEYGKPRAQRRKRDGRPPGAQGSRRARAKPEKARGSAAGQTHARGDLWALREKEPRSTPWMAPLGDCLKIRCPCGLMWLRPWKKWYIQRQKYKDDPGEWRFRKICWLHFTLSSWGIHAVQSAGVTSACKQGTSLDVLVTQGRWQHLYIDGGPPVHGENHPPAQGPCFVCTNGQPFQNCEPERDAWNEDSWSAHCGPLWRGSSRRWRGLLTAESLFTVAYAGHEYLALTDGTGCQRQKPVLGSAGVVGVRSLYFYIHTHTFIVLILWFLLFVYYLLLFLLLF